MEAIKNLNKWANAHTYYSLDFIRIIVGVFLFMKGVSFMTNTEYYNQLLDPIKSFGGGMLIVHYVMAAHMMGGVMIIFGLLTRWAIIAQIPILLGAFLINFTYEMNVINLIISLTLLCVSVFFLFYGSGKHSADYYFKMQQ